MSYVKLIFYQKNSSKPVVISDKNSSDTDDELKEKINKIMESEKVQAIETESDYFIFRPSELFGIMISKSKGDFKDLNISPDKKSPPPKEDKPKPSTNVYETELVINND